MSRGQYLERPALVPVGGLVLEGLWHRGSKSPPVLVLPPPPEAGSMDHVVCAELAWAAARAGRPVLRFNFRGVGASQGARGDPASRVEDAAGALRLLRENSGAVEVAVAAVGDSAATALALVGEHPGIVAVALVNPPAGAVAACPEVPLLCILREDEPGRAGLVAATGEAGGRVETARNLPEVGRLALRWLEGADKPPES